MSAMTRERIERIVSASMGRMADFASHVEPGQTYTEADIAAAVIAEPTGDTARFLAGVIAKSIEVVSVLDSVDPVLKEQV
jgi:hypothetical protein